MDKSLIGMGALAVVGVSAMYGDGMLLTRGVDTWAQLLLFTSGGLIGLGITVVATAGLLRELYRRG